MTKKEKYIEAFLDGYFVDKKLSYGMIYYSVLEEGTKKAEKKWRQCKKQKL